LSQKRKDIKFFEDPTVGPGFTKPLIIPKIIAKPKNIANVVFIYIPYR
jgi:hypothetical protein